MTSLLILLCTTGIYHEIPLAHEHCKFYNVTIHSPNPEVDAKVDLFCKLAAKLAIKHGGKLTKCEVVLLPEKPDDRRSRDLRA